MLVSSAVWETSSMESCWTQCQFSEWDPISKAAEPGWGNMSALTRPLQLGCQSLNWGHASSRSLLFYPCLCLSEATRRPSWGRLIVEIKDLAETTQRCWHFSLWKFLCKIIIQTVLELGDWERENSAFIFLNYLQKNKTVPCVREVLHPHLLNEALLLCLLITI